MSIASDAAQHLVEGIVDHPEAVRVSSRELRRGPLIEVGVDGSDLGRVIGRSGRTARALRTVVGALPGGRGARVDLVDAEHRR